MTILVTGGLGFVGSHFVWDAIAEGRRVVVLDDGDPREGAAMPAGVEVVHGDIGDRDAVLRVVRGAGVRAVVHFAGKIQVGESVVKPRLYFDVNVGRSLVLLDALLDAGVEELVFSSSAAVYGVPDVVPTPEDAPALPINPYGFSKLAIERALEAYERAYGLRWAALRYFNAAGAHPSGELRERHDPETHLVPLAIDAALGRRPPLALFGVDYPTADGTCIRDYVHVSDLAAAHLRALELLATRSLGAINLGAGRGASVREVLSTVGEVAGAPVPVVVAPRRAGDPAALVADPARALAVLGFAPKRADLRVMVEDTLRSRR